MKFSHAYLVAFLATASGSTNIDDLSDYEMNERKLTRAKSNKCTIQVVDYLEIPGSSMGADEDLVFECELDEMDGGKSLPIFATEGQKNVFKKLLEDGNLVAAEGTLEFGSGNAVYNHEQFYISPLLDVEASIKKGDDKMTNTGRRLDGRRLSVMGDKPMLAVRVIDKNGLAYPHNAATMSDNIFGSGNDQVNLRSQLLACSHGKLNIVYDGVVWENTVPQVHRAAPGVIEVTIDVDITTSDRYTIHNAVTAAVNTKLGITLPGPFEQVMYILERCYTGCGWAAYAYINSWMSVYQAQYYYMPGVQVHELGHNFGMAHSGGLDGQTYTDHTGMMGNPLYSDEVGKMCYNPAKNWYLSTGGSFDWYGDQKLLLEPASGNGDFFQSIDLVGIADYSGDQNAPPVVVKLETNTNTDYFIGFNRAIGANAQNDEADNEIVIVETGSNGEAYSQSYLKAHLVQGESYTIENFSVGVLNLTITAKKIDLSLDPAVATIDISTVGAPPPSCNTVSIAITQDNYPSETSWDIKNVDEDIIVYGDVNGVFGLTLLDGNYVFTINDSYGDGICCGYGNGSYQVIVGGEVIKTGGQFAFQEMTNFEVSCDSSSTNSGPSPQPAASESKEPSQSPTFVPSSITASDKPSSKPSVIESMEPSISPTFVPTFTASDKPSSKPSVLESTEPSPSPTLVPSITASDKPSFKPSVLESMEPSRSPTFAPSVTVSDKPSVLPTFTNSSNPTMQLSGWPTSPPLSQQPVTSQPISQPTSPPVTQQPATSQPISQPPGAFPSLNPAISQDLVEVTILTDNYPGETSWQLFGLQRKPSTRWR